MMENFTVLLCVMYACKDLAQSLFLLPEVFTLHEKDLFIHAEIKIFSFI
uniref:Uncharacterized protein n=1 Tax=Anguilla anguilla TaxID=7936 RepID=A0A0E9P5S0_ANGAN